MDENEYMPEIYTLEDEEGNVGNYELIDIYDEGDNTYYALAPYYENPEDLVNDNGEFIILKVEDTGDEITLVSIESEEEYDRLGQIFIDRFDNWDDECECDCEDDGCDCDDEDCCCHHHEE
ncbi:MAG: DUF1292 domain-containing protein [Oscillospiraceae bacterium]|nr:DUF1292 domain-containing protein [Oscillospiraceae bacterium]